MQNEYELARSLDAEDYGSDDDGGYKPMDISVSSNIHTFWTQSLAVEGDNDTMSPTKSDEDTLHAVNTDESPLSDLSGLTLSTETTPAKGKHSSTESDDEHEESPPTGRKKLRSALTGSQGRGEF
jgi:hypothetical protein